jgi:hypothetical protein
MDCKIFVVDQFHQLFLFYYCVCNVQCCGTGTVGTAAVYLVDGTGTRIHSRLRIRTQNKWNTKIKDSRMRGQL